MRRSETRPPCPLSPLLCARLRALRASLLSSPLRPSWRFPLSPSPSVRRPCPLLVHWPLPLPSSASRWGTVRRGQRTQGGGGSLPLRRAPGMGATQHRSLLFPPTPKARALVTGRYGGEQSRGVTSSASAGSLESQAPSRRVLPMGAGTLRGASPLLGVAAEWTHKGVESD
jgi:hypothetical protein